MTKMRRASRSAVLGPCSRIHETLRLPYRAAALWLLRGGPVDRGRPGA